MTALCDISDQFFIVTFTSTLTMGAIKSRFLSTQGGHSIPPNDDITRKIVLFTGTSKKHNFYILI